MELDTVYKYLGLGIVVIIILYIILKSLTFQARLVEGMVADSKDTTDKDKVSVAIKTHTASIEDALIIGKYRKSYEETIIELEENINATILAGILNNAEKISANPSSDESQKFIASMNSMKSFKDTLNDSMKFLDNIKIGGSSGSIIPGGKWF